LRRIFLCVKEIVSVGSIIRKQDLPSTFDHYSFMAKRVWFLIRQTAEIGST